MCIAIIEQWLGCYNRTISCHFFWEVFHICSNIFNIFDKILPSLKYWLLQFLAVLDLLQSRSVAIKVVMLDYLKDGFKIDERLSMSGDLLNFHAPML